MNISLLRVSHGRAVRGIVLFIVLVTIQYLSAPVYASELMRSAKSDFSANPFMAFGYNPRTKITTGYLAALRTAPGRTDECKLVFSNNAVNKNEFFVRYFEGEGGSGSSYRRRDRVSLVVKKNIASFKFAKEEMGGDCDWIIPFVVESSVPENQDEVIVPIEADIAGDWISVYAIDARRARFHSRPDSSSVQKAFLVKGDLIYVYEEQPDWYYVRYDGERRKTEGWIRKSDTLQP